MADRGNPQTTGVVDTTRRHSINVVALGFSSSVVSWSGLELSFLMFGRFSRAQLAVFGLSQRSDTEAFTQPSSSSQDRQPSPHFTHWRRLRHLHVSSDSHSLRIAESPKPKRSDLVALQPVSSAHRNEKLRTAI